MNEMLTDDYLTRLLGEAASAYPVPEQGSAFVLEERGDGEPGNPWLRRRGALVTAAAAAVAVAFVLAQTVGLPGTHLNKHQVASLTVAPFAAGGGGGVGGGTTGGSTGGSSGGLQPPGLAPAGSSAVTGSTGGPNLPAADSAVVPAPQKAFASAPQAVTDRAFERLNRSV